ncbi:hypothetical protein E6O75_ATG11475 [Venturia nashicola]|uniref:DUF7703 domain-containing protein n=1 Tax=Venturia nashicola TaxID=86259 RepID=A0A4Z1P726_9PEZI|nr:hypothetical protein E6O75_ATG11475 [Venturia nashicola]
MATPCTVPPEYHTYLPLSKFDWSFNRAGPLPWSPGVFSIIAVFTGLAIWSTIHLTIQILFFFKQYRGLYFWSLIITSWALSIREIGFLMRWVAPHVPWQFSLALAEVGWIGMVTGFSIVLWSRLQIITSNKLIMRGVLWMIITNGFVFHSALVILQYGLAAASKSERGPWLKVLNPFERVQITMFTVQEVIISGLYMRAIYELLQERITHHADETRKALILLFVVQTVVIMLDIIVITLDLAGYFTLKAIIHSWVYGLKLELEFVVLNQLMKIAKAGVPGLSTISASGTEFTITQTSQTNSTPMASPSSGATLAGKQDWWPHTNSEATESHSTMTSRKHSLAHAPIGGLSFVPGGKRGPVRRSIHEIMEERSLNLDHIGVIPDP